MKPVNRKFEKLNNSLDISIVRDTKKNLEMPYVFRNHSDDKIPSSEKPLFISLHSMRSNTCASKSRFKDWNFLQPFDCYGYEQEGSYWLGSYPDMHLLKLLIQLIEKLKLADQFNGEIYIKSGSSASYAAVYLAQHFQAKAVYLSVPILSSETPYKSNQVAYERYRQVFGDKEISLDASNLLSFNTKTLYYIVDQRYGYKNFLKNNSLRFINRCAELGINFKYEVQPTIGHSVPYSMRHVLNFFAELPSEGVVSTGFPELALKEGIEFDKVNIATP